MEHPFSITAANPSLQLQPDRRGYVSFTVTNETDQIVVARSHALGVRPAREDWFWVEEAERQWGPRETQMVVVHIHVPNHIEPGAYRVNLLTADNANPDDRYSRSGDVWFTVKEIVRPPAPPEPEPEPEPEPAPAPPPGPTTAQRAFNAFIGVNLGFAMGMPGLLATVIGFYVLGTTLAVLLGIIGWLWPVIKFPKARG